MPTMYEIYDGHADRYDELVTCEDCEGNLRRTLRREIDWNGATVVEAGIGTGRVTRTYIDLAGRVFGFDRSVHMLDLAARNLSPWESKITLESADHAALPVPDSVADVFVEGWAFGHVAVDHGDELDRVVSQLMSEAERVTTPGGAIVIIETLGTNTDKPAPPLAELAGFYEEIERRYGFVREVIRTDYLFDSAERAEELCGFFFGPSMLGEVRARVRLHGPTSGAVTIPECTGIWVRR